MLEDWTDHAITTEELGPLLQAARAAREFVPHNGVQGRSAPQTWLRYEVKQMRERAARQERGR